VGPVIHASAEPAWLPGCETFVLWQTPPDLGVVVEIIAHDRRDEGTGAEVRPSGEILILPH
jgi:hypothetical protein